MPSTTIAVLGYLIICYVRLTYIVGRLSLISESFVIKLDVGLFSNLIFYVKQVKSPIKLIISLEDTRENKLFSDFPSRITNLTR